MDPYEWVDSSSLTTALRGFLPAMRRRGEELQRRGAVGDWTVLELGRAFSATVLDGTRRSVEIFCEEFGERLAWAGDCDCSDGIQCEHIYATLQELLALKSASAVQSLSAGHTSPGEKPGGALPPKPTSLKALLSQAVGRSLTKEEDRYIRLVQSVYQRCRLYRALSLWDLQELGIVFNQKRGHPEISA